MRRFRTAISLVLTTCCRYRRHEIGLRMAIFFSAATAAGAFGGLFARSLVELDGVQGRPGYALLSPTWYSMLKLLPFLAGLGSSSLKALSLLLVVLWPLPSLTTIQLRPGFSRLMRKRWFCIGLKKIEVHLTRDGTRSMPGTLSGIGRRARSVLVTSRYSTRHSADLGPNVNFGASNL